MINSSCNFYSKIKATKMCRKNRKMFHCLNDETAANWITIGLQNKYVLKGGGVDKGNQCALI